MADLSKIKLNGTTYNFKDNEARNLIENFEETDPTVPGWAKQSTKPTYTAAEVGALPDTTVIPNAVTNTPNPNQSGYVLFKSTNTTEELTATETKRVQLSYNSKNHFDTFKISGGQTYNGDDFYGGNKCR